MRVKFEATKAVRALALCFLLLCGTACAEAPPFGGAALPVPPQQNAPWAPPPGAPADLVEATQTLFQYGLADPRGCEYREFQVRNNECIGGAYTQSFEELDAYSLWDKESRPAERTIKGWLLPGEGTKNRFAIGWNGLVYPVLTIGEAADITKDLPTEKPSNYWRGWLRLNNVSESMASWPASVPYASCLLLRLGRIEEATRLWNTFNRGPHNAVAFTAGYWLWAQMARALNAHVMGDEQLALLDLRRLSEVAAPLKQAFLAGRSRTASGGRTMSDYDIYSRDIEFLDYLPALLADCEIRERKRKVPAAPKDKVAALIENLSEVRVFSDREWKTPDFAEDPFIKELVAQGDAAVEPLLEVLAHDDRLTRSVGATFFRSTGRRIYTVAEAALFSLRAIFGDYPLGEDKELKDPLKRSALVAKARQHWAQNKELKPAERWYLLLRDDAAGPEQWALASDKITDATQENGPLAGEELRAKHEPTVSALMAQRVNDSIALARKTYYLNGLKQLCHAGNIARYLRYWDEKAAPPLLKSYFVQAGDFLAQSPPEIKKRFQRFREEQLSEGDGEMVRAYGEAASALVRVLNDRLIVAGPAAEPAILDEYAAWLKKAAHGPLWTASAEEMCGVFGLLAINPQHKGLAEAAEVLFAGKDSPFNPWLPPGPGNEIFAPIIEVTMTIPACRRMMLRQLEDTKVIGQARFDAVWLDYWKGEFGYRNSKKESLRTCDLYAFLLGWGSDSAPKFKFEWPIAKRDAAIRAARIFLRRFDGQFRFVDSDSWGQARMELESKVATRVATVQDVARGTAIFSLNGPQPKRVADIPLPRSATCIIHGGPQHGSVWQAEEIFENGKWQRYYGFCGNGVLVKVAAQDIAVQQMQ